MHNPIKIIDNLIEEINHDSYTLTRDDIDSIEWKLREIQAYMKELYAKRGKQL